MTYTKASVAKIRHFQEYSIEDRSFFARQSFDEEEQDLDITLVEERGREEGREDEERETEAMSYLLVIQFLVVHLFLQSFNFFRWFCC